MTELSEADKKLEGVEPVAWMHTLHMELGQTNVWLTDQDVESLFGVPGLDFPKSCHVTITPLYSATDLLPLFKREREEAAALCEDGFRCRTCNAIFNGEQGHPYPECDRPNWDRLTPDQAGAAIRSLSTKDTNHDTN